jgi:hypothetical protein
MLLVVNVLVWKKVFKGVVLVMHFPRHANVVQQMKKDAKISNMSLLSLQNQVYRNALLGEIFLGRVGKSGRKLELKLNTPMKTRYCLLLILNNFFNSFCFFDISKSNLVLIFFLLLCKFVNKIIMFQEALQF